MFLGNITRLTRLQSSELKTSKTPAGCVSEVAKTTRRFKSRSKKRFSGNTSPLNSQSPSCLTIAFFFGACASSSARGAGGLQAIRLVRKMMQSICTVILMLFFVLEKLIR